MNSLFDFFQSILETWNNTSNLIVRSIVNVLTIIGFIVIMIISKIPKWSEISIYFVFIIVCFILFFILKHDLKKLFQRIFKKVF